MKGKKLYIFLYITIFILVAGSFIFIYNLIHYTIDIENPADIVKIRYTNYDGDVYQLTDKQIINQFIDSINGMTFKRERTDLFTSYPHGYMAFYNKECTKVYSLQIEGDTTIKYNNALYKSDTNIDTKIFSEYGRYIENIHY